MFWRILLMISNCFRPKPLPQISFFILFFCSKRDIFTFSGSAGRTQLEIGTSGHLRDTGSYGQYVVVRVTLHETRRIVVVSHNGARRVVEYARRSLYDVHFWRVTIVASNCACKHNTRGARARQPRSTPGERCGRRGSPKISTSSSCHGGGLRSAHVHAKRIITSRAPGSYARPYDDRRRVRETCRWRNAVFHGAVRPDLPIHHDAWRGRTYYGQ